MKFCQFTLHQLQNNNFFFNCSVYWWSFFHKPWASQSEEHAFLVCGRSSLASPSWSSMTMESECLVQHHWQSCYWTILYWRIVIKMSVCNFFIWNSASPPGRSIMANSSVHVVPTHDGCPTYYTLVARQVLNRKFPDQRIKCGGPVRWPAHSPDLTPFDFSFGAQ